MKQLKNVTGPKCALSTRCLRGRPTAEKEEEGKEKTQEFKIPVVAVLRPEGVLCAVPLCHAQYAITGLA